MRVVVLLASLAAGSGAAWLNFREKPVEIGVASVIAEPAPVEMPAMEQVLVAVRDLGHRDRVGSDDLIWQPWPAAAVPQGFITYNLQPDAVEELSGRIVRRAMLAGEPLHPDKLASMEAGFLASLLPAGMRAVAVRVSAETTAGGFILPEDRVDVLHTLTPQDASASVSRTILTNIRVLAVDQQVANDNDAATVARTVTLELDPKNAEIVAAAEASGSLSLALRSIEDNAEAPLSGGTAERTITLITSGRSEMVKPR